MNDNIKKENAIIKTNPLNEARHNLDILEYKLVLVAISMMEKKDRELYTIDIKVKAFASILKVESTNIYQSLISKTKKLATKTVSIYNSKTDTYEHYPWFGYIKYRRGEGIISLQFNKYLKDFLLFFSNNIGYTKYLLKNIIEFKNTQSIKLYEILKQYEKIGIREFEFEELKSFLGLSNRYNDYSNFKLRILDPCKKELLQKADIYFTFNPIKEGRAIKTIKFSIHKNKGTTDEIEQFSKIEIIGQIQKIFSLKFNNSYHIPYNLLDKKHRFILIKILEILKDKVDPNKIRSPKGWLLWQIEEVEGCYDLEKIKNLEDF